MALHIVPVMMLKFMFLRCEPFDTYPRTYDLLHAAGLFSIEQKRYKFFPFDSFGGRPSWNAEYRGFVLIYICVAHRCNISTIILEMDRMLRPGGRVYIRDSVSVIGELQELASAVGWVPALHDTGEGPHASWKILMADKRLWQYDLVQRSGCLFLQKGSKSLTARKKPLQLTYCTCFYVV